MRSRTQKARLNMLTTLLSQLIAIVCGILIPRCMIGRFGSETYGATASIAQFLSYIALLEGGIGGVARAELYSPLAEQDKAGVSRVYHAVKRFLRVMGLAFGGYALMVAFFYHDIAGVTAFDRYFTCGLVLVIAVSTAAQYFVGLADLTLLHADQKRYISNLVVIVTTVFNTLLVLLLIRLGCSILVVKLVSSCVFLLRPVCFSLYVRTHYRLATPLRREPYILRQRWAGVGQHIAYFLHTNTDVVVLTLFADLRQVAVYTIYHMIVGNIRHLVTALTGGMEPLFGDMQAKGEYSLLHKTYRRFELLLAVASTVLFGTAAVMILPFVKLYTAGVTDAEYIQPAFAVVLLLTEAIHCMLLPCTGLPVAANRFKETRWGAYGEALLNIGLSCLLVWWEPLLGVAIGTLLSTLFKGFFYLRYAARHILHVSFRRMLKTYLFRIWLLATIVLGGMWCMYRVPMDHLAAWCLWGVAAFAAVSGITLAAHILCAPRELRQAFRWLATSFLKRDTDSAEALYEEAPDR